ncbi:MAG: Flp pilus assembly complex ATPase component TadA [Oscillospiraceae bacterium]|jgi:stage III sporulation protein AA|nr:Flp pilus assembly complex ATPase component TadA [Oscillospiraceae bacterium]
MELHLGAKPFDQAAAHLPHFLRERLAAVPEGVRAQTREIRLRAGAPMTLTTAAGTLFFSERGGLAPLYQPPCLCLDAGALAQALQSLCGYSVHSYAEDIARGFLTLPGGHRAGICGTAVVQGGRVTAVRNVSSVNLRIAREVPGAATALCQRLFTAGQLPSVLIAGAPGSGKTTLLRDLALRLSSGLCGAVVRVAAVDERGEIAGVREGLPCCNVGAATDVLTGYPKEEGILLALRSLSPEMILCDELGGEADAAALEQGFHAGVSFAASLHAGSAEEALARPVARRLLAMEAFDWLVQLEGAAKPCAIRELVPLRRRERELPRC